MGEAKIDPLSGQKTTGHEWDGIEELATPLPRWWVMTIILTFAVAFVYAWLYPSIPTTYDASAGYLKWTSRLALADAQEEAKQEQARWLAGIKSMSPGEIAANEELRTFAITGGRALFNQNCSGCHGVGAGGQQGQFPSLIDDDWLWGGSLDAIYQTIMHGIRNGDGESRQSEMPAFDGALPEEEIVAAAAYVLTLSDASADESRKTLAGAAVFENNCAPCHGASGEGMRELGAPRLNDQIWLYGMTKEAIIRQIKHPRMGMMPAWGARLGPENVKMLTLYVHSLGGGE